MLESEVPSQLVAPSTTRLVIRVKLPQPSPPPARRHLSRTALLLIVGVVAILLGWFGISAFLKSDRVEDAPVVSDQLAPKPAAEITVPSVAKIEPKAVETAVTQPDAPPSPINQVIPNASQSALDTIRGTIRVSVRVNIDKQGSVVDATAIDRGPSRYFERLAVGASKQWTFTPASSAERRTMLLKFSFTRAGVTAEASAAD